MKAVNLIPGESRRGAAAVSRTGGAAYLVLGVLGALVLLASIYAFEGSRIGDKRAQAAEATQQAQQLRQQADSLSKYTAFAQLKDKRIQTVSDLAKNRFDWAGTLHDLARAIPPSTWLTDLVGTVSPDVQVEGGGGNQLRSALEVPAIDISGCTTSQSAVSKMMARMRLISGVERVSLVSSAKADTAAGQGDSAGSGGDSGDCTAGSDQYPKFELIVFFKAMESPAGADQAAATPAPTSTGASQ